MSIAVRPLTDPQIIFDLYQSPEFSVVSHDHRPVSPVFHQLASYLGAYVGKVLAGVFLLIRFSPLEVEVHALILRKFIRQSRILGRACLAHVFAQPGVARATAYVIEGLESAKNYCLKLGFQQEGFRRTACAKDGILLGVHVMGITRQDWEVA